MVQVYLRLRGRAGFIARDLHEIATEKHPCVFILGERIPVLLVPEKGLYIPVNPIDDAIGEHALYCEQCLHLGRQDLVDQRLHEIGKALPPDQKGDGRSFR